MNNIKLIALFFLFTINAIQGQDNSKNGLGVELGYGGGDGIFPTYIYGLQYTRDFTSRLTGYAKYNLSTGADERTSLEDKYILEDNTAETPNTLFGQFIFVGVGLEFKVVKTPKSFLYLISGFRYTQNKRSRTGGYLDWNGERITSSSNFQKNGFGYEIGIGYKRRFAQKYFVGGSINYANFDTRFSASGMIGVYF